MAAAGSLFVNPILLRAWGLLLAGLLCWLPGALWANDLTVRVGVYANSPKIMTDPATGMPGGILGDLLMEMAERERWTVVPVPCEWEACLRGVAEGRIDLLPDVARTPERAAQFGFHRVPSLHSWSQLYSRPDDNFDSLLELDGRRLAVLAGSVQEEFVRNLLDSFGLSVQWVLVPTLEEGFARVAQSEADAVVANHRFGDAQAPVYGLRQTAIIFQPAQLFYITGLGRNTELLDTIDRYLEDWKADRGSVYHETLRRYAQQPEAGLGVPAALWWGLGAMVTLLLLALGVTGLLKRQVAEKTRHLQDSEQRLNTILDSVEAFIYIKDRQHRYVYANRRVCELFGKPLEQVVGQTDAQFFDAATVANIHHNDTRVLQDGVRVSAEETNQSRADGSVRTFLSVKLPLRAGNGQVYALCGISTDLTEFRRAQQEIRQLAYFDTLTGLPNRRQLLDRLQPALALHQRSTQDGALLFVDLDDFKILNETLGHEQGDELLRQMGLRLSQAVRDGDTVARLGSDEFVVMLQGLSAKREEAALQAEAVARKLQSVLANPYDLRGAAYGCTASIGVALFSDAQGSLDTMLRLADMAMASAKAEGRNVLRFFDPAMQTRVQSLAALENDLREALAQQQFRLFYQPQVDELGRVRGMEALLRWEHPQRGLVSPGEFIPVAESGGLILPIGRWVLKTACEQLVRWAHTPETAHWTLAVNVSARQFRQSGFANEVLEVLHATGAPPQRLELEITESQLLDDIDSVIAKMSLLQYEGVTFSLDDFGTGYSALAYLKRLPLAKLKIDQGFVRDLLTDPNDAAIVRTIVALGQSLDLRVIAEGVETEEQRAVLQQLGCNEYQGYLFSRPMPLEALEARWLSGAP
ncbi:MAG: EAL domain-containing protein [Serpentinimonas sp.]|nr:EAL domain-containing protein [Serpentinimonas sp.]